MRSSLSRPRRSRSSKLLDEAEVLGVILPVKVEEAKDKGNIKGRGRAELFRHNGRRLLRAGPYY